MKAFHKWLTISLFLLGALCGLYFLYLSIIYGFFQISLSWVFAIIFLCCVSIALLEFHYQRHLITFLPLFLQRILLLCICLGITIFCLLEGYIIYKGNMTSATQANTAIVLGAQLQGSSISRSLRYRLDRAIDFHKQNPNALIIVSGGQGMGEDCSEAQAMADYLMKHGINEEHIQLEDQSTNTQENFRFSYEKYLSNKENTNITIITNNFHMARATFIAQQYNFKEIYTYPAKTDMDLMPVFYVREFFGFCKDFALSILTLYQKDTLSFDKISFFIHIFALYNL